MSRRDRFVLWVSELGYWHITRHVRKFYPWVARKLPYWVKYWVIVNTAAKLEAPYNLITWDKMLDVLEEERG